ncbi:MAG: hypothetical protein LUQ71_02450 [Methanoregula sp.]|nr:hypothetical protein [Methanoregula sp.]
MEKIELSIDPIAMNVAAARDFLTKIVSTDFGCSPRDARVKNNPHYAQFIDGSSVLHCDKNPQQIFQWHPADLPAKNVCPFQHILFQDWE